MSRFYVPEEKIDLARNEAVIDGKEAHHVLDVMRLKDADKVVVFDGTGKEYTGFIKNVDLRARKVTVEIIKTEIPSGEKTSEVILAQAMPKKGKMDYIIEKATELGVRRIIPLVTERTIVRPDDSGGEKKVSRWRRLALEAAKQCGRADVPEVDEITPYRDIIKTVDRYDLALVAYLSGKTSPMKKALEGFRSGKLIVFIGPEGDFTPEEASLADTENCRHVSLGWRVLKSDTAGLFVLSVLCHEFNI
jgi:16S rRNA (uracil1498-N3)-methyltransferase